jgi:molecular chaperone DnaK
MQQVLQGSDPVVVPLSAGASTLPSVVAFLEDGSVEVGSAAKRLEPSRAHTFRCSHHIREPKLRTLVLHRLAITNPRTTFASVKRFIGQKASDVEAEAELVSAQMMTFQAHA